MDLRTVRRRAAARLAELDLPHPFSTTALAQRLGEQRGRPIHLLANGTGIGPCGIWFATDTTDVVFYDSTTTGLHREHIIAHELAHVMCHHGASEVLTLDVIRALMPEVDPASVRAMLSRSSYNTAEEREAEVLASLVLQQAEVRIAQPAAPAGDPEIARLDGMLARRRRARG